MRNFKASNLLKRQITTLKILGLKKFQNSLAHTFTIIKNEMIAFKDFFLSGLPPCMFLEVQKKKKKAFATAVSYILELEGKTYCLRHHILWLQVLRNQAGTEL